MKLLILTQKIDINDDVLGFFHDWVNEFAKHCEQITVICLQKGEYDLPANVKVLSLGKEKSKCKLKYLYKFYRYIFQERKNYDTVFVHMNPEYVVLGGLFWRLWRKKIGLWYTHKQVNLKLRIASKFVNVIFTASKESCNLKSGKIKIVGHGVNLERFKNLESRFKNENFNIIYVGRISPIKNQKLLIQAIDIIAHRDVALPRLDADALPRLKVKLIGSPIYKEDEEYQVELKRIIKEKRLENIIEFVGPVPNNNILSYYQPADLAVNLCPTGGVDKAVLEAMACGVPVLAFNKAFVDLLGEYAEAMILQQADPEELAEKIKKTIVESREERGKNEKDLRALAISQFSLDNLVKKICSDLKI